MRATIAVGLLLLSGCAQQRRLEEIDVKVPAPTMRLSFPIGYAVGLPFCVGGTALVKMARVERRLTYGESWTVLGSCVVPVVGGYLVKRTFSDSPLWDQYPIDINGPIEEVPEYLRR